MPNGLRGNLLADRLQAERAGLKVILSSGYTSEFGTESSPLAEHCNFLEKPYSDNTLVDRVEQAMAVEAASVADNAAALERQARLAGLREREREVMQRVAVGKLNKGIADELHIAVRTVEVHRARVFSKLGVKSAAELAGWLATG